MSAVSQLILASALLMQAVEQDDPDFEKQQIEKWVKYYANLAKEYSIFIGPDLDSELTVHPKPVLRWHNPIAGTGTTHGVLLVWTRQGRPEAVGTIFSYVPSGSVDKSKRVVAHSFHSLSLEPLNASKGEVLFWHPREAGVEFHLIPEAPRPAENGPARLTQMRTLARQFTAATTDQNGTERPLRVLPQPIYRYRSERADLLDGGLFAFVQGTDPEVLLLIEARADGDGFQWQYAPARFSHLRLELRHSDVEVWKDNRPFSAFGPSENYHTVHGVAVRDRIIP